MSQAQRPALIVRPALLKCSDCDGKEKGELQRASLAPDKQLPVNILARWWWLAVTIPLLVTYLLTVSPYPLLEDDTLFILASYFAGTAHAPGYPAYVLLTQPFQLLPMESVALKVHLVNVVLAVGLCTSLAVWLKQITGCIGTASTG